MTPSSGCPPPLAESDDRSVDTFRAEQGPEYYSMDIGKVHDPCNSVDDQAIRDPSKSPTCAGAFHDRQLEWLANDLAQVPEDKLVEILGDRKVRGPSGRAHSAENILADELFEGFEQKTRVGPAPFHQIVTGARSGSRWGGSLDDNGVPTSTQRPGSPRGFYQLDFAGSDCIDTCKSFTQEAKEQFQVSSNPPRYRDWEQKMMDFVDMFAAKHGDITPPPSRGRPPASSRSSATRSWNARCACRRESARFRCRAPCPRSLCLPRSRSTTISPATPARACSRRRKQVSWSRRRVSTGGRLQHLGVSGSRASCTSSPGSTMSSW